MPDPVTRKPIIAFDEDAPENWRELWAQEEKAQRTPPAVNPSDGAAALTTIAQQGSSGIDPIGSNSLVKLANRQISLSGYPVESDSDKLARRINQKKAESDPNSWQSQDFRDKQAYDQVLSGQSPDIESARNSLAGKSQADLTPAQPNEDFQPSDLLKIPANVAVRGAGMFNVLPNVAPDFYNKALQSTEPNWGLGKTISEFAGGAAKIIPELAIVKHAMGPGMEGMSEEQQGAAVFGTQTLVSGIAPVLAGKQSPQEVLNEAVVSTAVGGAFPVVTGAASSEAEALLKDMSPAIQKAGQVTAEVGAGATIGASIPGAEAAINGTQATPEDQAKSAVSLGAFGLMGALKSAPKGFDQAEYGNKLNRVIEAITGIESHGAYFHADGTPIVNRLADGREMIGKYQQNDQYLAERTKKYLGEEMDPEDFKYDTHAQEIVGQGFIADLYAKNVKKYGMTDRAVAETVIDYNGRGHLASAESKKGFLESPAYAKAAVGRYRRADGSSVPDINEIHQQYQDRTSTNEPQLGENGFPTTPQNQSSENVAAPAKAGDRVTTGTGETTVASVAGNGEVQLATGEFVGVKDFESGKVKIANEEQAASTVRQKIMITRADESNLRDLGYTQSQIDKMKPQEAGDILDAKKIATNETTTENTPAADTTEPVGVDRGTPVEEPLKKLIGDTQEIVNPDGETITIPTKTDNYIPEEKVDSDLSSQSDEPYVSPRQERIRTEKLARETSNDVPGDLHTAVLNEFAWGKDVRLRSDLYENDLNPKGSTEYSRDALKKFHGKDGMNYDQIAEGIGDVAPHLVYDDRNGNGNGLDVQGVRNEVINVLSTYGTKFEMREELARRNPRVQQEKAMAEQREKDLMYKAHFGDEPIFPEAAQAYDIPLIDREDAIPNHLVPILDEYRNEQTGNLDHERLANDLGSVNENSTGIQKDLYEHKDEIQRLATGRAEEALPTAFDTLPPEPDQREEYSEYEQPKIEPASEQPEGNSETTGVRNEATDAAREKFGLPPLEETKVKHRDELHEQAREKINGDPKVADRLVTELLEKPRTTSDVENEVLHIEMAKRVKEVDDSFDAINNAPDEGKEGLKPRRDEALDALDKITRATKQGSNRELGKALQSLQNQVEIDDGSPAGVVRRMQAIENNGKPLSEEQKTRAAEHSSNITEMKKRLDEANAAITDAHVSALLSGIGNEVVTERNEAKKSGKKYLDFTAARAARGEKFLSNFFNKELHDITAIFTPELSRALFDVGVHKIASGFSNLADWSKEMVKTLGEKVKPFLTENLFKSAQEGHEKLSFDRGVKKGTTGEDVIRQARENSAAGAPLDKSLVYKLARAKINEGVERDDVMSSVHADLAPLHEGLTERDVRVAFSDYGKQITPSQAPDLKTLRELRRLTQLGLATEDALSGKAPLKSGRQRDKPTPDVREAMKGLKDAMDKAGFETSTPEEQLASRSEARKTRLTNEIEDLNKQIESGTRNPKRTNNTDTYDDDTKKLILDRDAKKEELDKIAPPQGRTDEEKLASWTKQIEKKTTEIRARIEAAKTDPSVYAPKIKSERVLNAAAEKAKADYEGAKIELKHDMERHRLDERTPVAKFFDELVKLRVAGALSSGLTNIRIIGSCLSRLAGTPIEEIAGMPWASLPYKGADGEWHHLGERAPRQGGFSMRAEINAAASLPEGLKDSWKNMKFKYNDLQKLYEKDKLTPPTWEEYLGYLHNAGKAPAVRAEFVRSKTKRIENREKYGTDVTDAKIEELAWNDAMRAKYSQDNIATKVWTNSMNYLAKVPDSKVGAALAHGAARGMKVLIPFANIPTNLAFETINDYALGLITGGVRLATAYAKGIETLPEDHIESILRSLKKGSVGMAIMSMGYIYHKELKDSLDKMNLLSHIPQFMILKMAVTIGQTEDEYVKGVKKGTLPAIAEGLMDLGGHLPFVDPISKALEARKSSDALSSYLFKVGQGIVTPAGLSWVAKAMDSKDGVFLGLLGFGETIKRAPETMLEGLEMGIPGLRQTLPVAKDKKQPDRSFDGEFKRLNINDAMKAYEKATPEQRRDAAEKLSDKYDRAINKKDKDGNMVNSPEEIEKLTSRFREVMSLPR